MIPTTHATSLRRHAACLLAAAALLLRLDTVHVGAFQAVNRHNGVVVNDINNSRRRRNNNAARRSGGGGPLAAESTTSSSSSSSASSSEERIQPPAAASSPSSSSSSSSAAIVVVETDAQIRDRILSEIDSGLRRFDAVDSALLPSYGDPDEDLLQLLDNDDDPTAIDASTLGQWDEGDFESKFDYEWDPSAGDADPNDRDVGHTYADAVEVDDVGNEVGYDPIFGPSNAIDDRTILDPPDSYVIDERTRDERSVPRDFPDGDPERDANANFVTFRKSLGIVETYRDEHLGSDVPRHVAKWHGYPEQLSYPRREYTNNRFTRPEDRTDFDALGPAKARKVAVQMARSKNNEWLPAGTYEAHRERTTAIYRERGIIVGTTLPGEVDEMIANRIRPALDVLGDVVELLSVECGTVFRFKYHGLIKNKRGMEAWAGVLIRDCDVDCTGVVFETGWRKRDPYYDGGDKWYGPY
ncbi:hypothetical protein ACHAW5_008386 [Stephanodiscus triporus]|uniref:Uncharacterized protein n=1 Tax=Stephanodiscus triporus TaxID=2934178 RepID=A0ABD3N3X7_9STRA